MHGRTIKTIATIGLTVIGLAVVVGGVILALDDAELPGELIAIGGLAVGGVAGVLGAERASV